MNADIRLRVFERDFWTCRYCGYQWPEAARRLPMDYQFFKVPMITIDHIVPASRGGKTRMNNLVTSCRKCNEKRGHVGPELDALQRQVKYLSRADSNLYNAATRIVKLERAVNAAVEVLGKEIAAGPDAISVTGDPAHALAILREALK